MIECLSVEQAELVGYTIMADYGPVGTAFYPRHAHLFAASGELLAALKGLLDDEVRIGRCPERLPLLQAAARAVIKAERGS